MGSFSCSFTTNHIRNCIKNTMIFHMSITLNVLFIKEHLLIINEQCCQLLKFLSCDSPHLSDELFIERNPIILVIGLACKVCFYQARNDRWFGIILFLQVKLGFIDFQYFVLLSVSEQVLRLIFLWVWIRLCFAGEKFLPFSLHVSLAFFKVDSGLKAQLKLLLNIGLRLNADDVLSKIIEDIEYTSNINLSLSSFVSFSAWSLRNRSSSNPKHTCSNEYMNRLG